MGAKRNRTAGHNFERDVIKLLIEMGIHPHAVSCRSCNGTRDGEGIDITNSDESVHGRMIDDIQCKSTISNPDYVKLLKAIKHESRFPVIFHRRTKKSGTKFMVQGEYAITYMKDYLKLLAYREAYKIVAKKAGLYFLTALDNETLDKLNKLTT